MSRILLVEDNPRLAGGLVANLEVEGYETRATSRIADATRLVADFAPDLVILDLMLPDGDGFDFLRALREDYDDLPVMILSARDDELDKVKGFRWGADDYVTKPFGLMELLARVESLLRRSRSGEVTASGSRDWAKSDGHALLSFGDVVVDPAARVARKAGREVHLTPKAFDLLLALYERGGAVASRLELMRDVWGHRAPVQSRTVDAHVVELRRALEDDPVRPRHILTVWKAGYRLRL